ncbi:MAG TPA: superinfection immunity protein, partial [Streptosporangiaceae bacterium]|nr:superinfection immunity protein [Streptosporangiaceae bacterium]
EAAPAVTSQRHDPITVIDGRNGQERRGQVMQGLISAWLIGMLIVVIVTTYLLPTLVAWLRHAPDAVAATLLNITLGWTLIGWIVALVIALREPAGPVVQVIGQLNAPPANGYYWGPQHPGQGPITGPHLAPLPDSQHGRNPEDPRHTEV